MLSLASGHSSFADPPSDPHPHRPSRTSPGLALALAPCTTALRHAPLHPTPHRSTPSPLSTSTPAAAHEILWGLPPNLSSTTPAVFHHDFRRLLPPARARSRPRLPVSTHETHELASAYLFARIHQ
ncbi:hypothetical protein ZWY2020_046998 [Hordeum vulgare]|nr:hypothetical protein ZWY2020_046998 [Hordeum vulgare]